MSQQKGLPNGPRPMLGTWMIKVQSCADSRNWCKAVKEGEEDVCRKKIVLSDASLFKKPTLSSCQYQTISQMRQLPDNNTLLGSGRE